MKNTYKYLLLQNPNAKNRFVKTTKTKNWGAIIAVILIVTLWAIMIYSWRWHW